MSFWNAIDQCKKGDNSLLLEKSSTSIYIRRYSMIFMLMSQFLDPLSPEQKCCKNNNVPSKCLDMCVVTRDFNSRSLQNEDSIVKYCNQFWNTVGRCRNTVPGTNFDVLLIV